MIPVIALIGRPNVGKSTLFNVFTRSRDAIVADQPGLTRDRQYGAGERNGKSFIVIDTGGLSGEKQDLDDLMARQTRLAIDEADEVLFIVDARAGLTSADRLIADIVRKSGKSCHVVLNKTDGLDVMQAQADFYALGFHQLHAVAAAHRKGTSALLEQVLEQYPAEEAVDSAGSGPVVAVIGRPNVGKSTLINRLLGAEVQEVREIRNVGDKGKHTTTRRELFLLPTGGAVIDTPGVREFGLWDGDPGSFADIEELAGHCRFRDCGHETQPGCAIRAAIDSGELEAGRLVSYRKMRAELRRVEAQKDKHARLEEKRRVKRVFKGYKAVLAEKRRREGR